MKSQQTNQKMRYFFLSLIQVISLIKRYGTWCKKYIVNTGKTDLFVKEEEE